MDLRHDEPGKPQVCLASWVESIGCDVLGMASQHLAVACKIQKMGAGLAGYQAHSGVPRRYERVHAGNVRALHPWKVGEIRETDDQDLHMRLPERQNQITEISEKGTARIPCQDVIGSEEDRDEARANGECSTQFPLVPGAECGAWDSDIHEVASVQGASYEIRVAVRTWNHPDAVRFRGTQRRIRTGERRGECRLGG